MNHRMLRTLACSIVLVAVATRLLADNTPPKLELTNSLFAFDAFAHSFKSTNPGVP